MKWLSWHVTVLACLSGSIAVLLAIGAHVQIGSVVHAQTPDPDSVAAGMRIYRQKGDCQACHGWAADGRKMDSQMPDGANLRTTKLDREKLVAAIKCGIPGKSMPAFDRLAYSDGRCYGMKEADLKRLQVSLPDPPATLQPGRSRCSPIFYSRRSSARVRWIAPRASSTGGRTSRPVANFRSDAPPARF